MNFNVLILGSDANAYYMARACYEAYHKKAHLLGKTKLAFTKFSNILTIEYHDDLWEEKSFVSILNAYAQKHSEKILVVSTNETYSLFLARNAQKLAKNLIFFKQDVQILETLMNKEKFYKTYKKSSLSFPKTFYIDVQNDNIIPTIEYPVILKPANVILYNHLSFFGKKKIYKLDTETEVKETLQLLKKAHYNDKMILQEFIEGNDSYLFDSVVYVDRNGEPKIISFAQIGIQERKKSMVGNAAALINGFNTFDGDVEKAKQNILSFMQKLGMNGFFEVDMKYDSKTKEFKVLEINARQGRCSYYLVPLGANLIQIMVDDLIFQKDLPFKDLKEEVLLSFIPKGVLKKYTSNNEFKKKALSLWKKRVSPMECPKDKNIKRFLMMKKRLWHYYKEYKNSDWEE